MLQKHKRCLICHTTQNLQMHHVFEGTRRKASDIYGLTVWLCMKHHTGDEGIHNNEALNLQLKRKTQREFERIYGHDKFMEVFHKNYLE